MTTELKMGDEVELRYGAGRQFIWHRHIVHVINTYGFMTVDIMGEDYWRSWNTEGVNWRRKSAGATPGIAFPVKGCAVEVFVDGQWKRGTVMSAESWSFRTHPGSDRMDLTQFGTVWRWPTMATINGPYSWALDEPAQSTQENKQKSQEPAKQHYRREWVHESYKGRRLSALPQGKRDWVHTQLREEARREIMLLPVFPRCCNRDTQWGLQQGFAMTTITLQCTEVDA